MVKEKSVNRPVLASSNKKQEELFGGFPNSSAYSLCTEARVCERVCIVIVKGLNNIKNRSLRRSVSTFLQWPIFVAYRIWVTVACVMIS